MIRVLSPTRLSFRELNQQLALGCGQRTSRRFFSLQIRPNITIRNCPTAILTKTPTRKAFQKQKRRASEMWGEDGKTRALLS
jgi:hypothetical protein